MSQPENPGIETGARPNGGGLPTLAAAIPRGLQLLNDLRTPHPEVTSGALEARLRREVALLTPGPWASPGVEHPGLCAVRTACAYLATRAYWDAYHALVAAEERLPRRPGPPSPEAERDPSARVRTEKDVLVAPGAGGPRPGVARAAEALA
ncbi:hypothetical protein [Actinomycetospora sp. TBRC 11914]|uniref:hypothetical protein n=1 Tax=Actinomycetospora sp. TBRC 11914 TaxID=2729387 RepID=UPI00145C5860|nr:hypothetical protein [Actinomycetospora sp. TBRC 11914]NMO91558.1 hypothetical protein [Actinomycetospora sp. TBRC 11914]